MYVISFEKKTPSDFTYPKRVVSESAATPAEALMEAAEIVAKWNSYENWTVTVENARTVARILAEE